jgi:hypothetical protein
LGAIVDCDENESCYVDGGGCVMNLDEKGRVMDMGVIINQLRGEMVARRSIDLWVKKRQPDGWRAQQGGAAR